jgi:hypothetical protein
LNGPHALFTQSVAMRAHLFTGGLGLG